MIHARPSLSFGKLGGVASRIAWGIALLIGLAGCGPQVGAGVIDFNALCLLDRPGDIGCCPPGDHIERTTCCPPGTHEVSDVEHADWVACLPDEAGADVGADAGTATELDAGADAP